MEPEFQILEWDTQHFGIRVGRVSLRHADEETLRRASKWAETSSIDCMYLLVNAGDAQSIRQAIEFGWRIVDIRVTLEAKVQAMAKSAPGVRHANTDDVAWLRELASRSHRASRFYADGNFPEKACDELFAKWIERSVLDRGFAGAVFVDEARGNEPAGYITCSVRAGEGRIGLIAVEEKSRGVGLGKRLLAESASWFARQGVERASVATQGGNVAALRMYQRCGFSIESVELWFHWWRKRNA